MNASKRMVNIFFVSSTLMCWVVFTKTLELVFDMARIHNSPLLGKEFTLATLAGAGLALALLFWSWRHHTIRPMINQVGDELTKVVWPTWDETKSKTNITVIVTMIIACILAVFDFVFKKLTTWILG